MALRTIGRLARLNKLPVMIIRVTIAAFCERQRVCKSGFVTLFTLNLPVLSFQSEIGQIVIETVGCPQNRKRLFSVTGFTVLTKFSLVNILVTGITILKPQTTEFPEGLPVLLYGLMTCTAGDGLVPACKPKPRAVMIKARRRNELVIIVTTPAILRQGLLMIICVTGYTSLGQPQIGKFLFSYFR